jgi:hypothetical protein
LVPDCRCSFSGEVKNALKICEVVYPMTISLVENIPKDKDALSDIFRPVLDKISSQENVPGANEAAKAICRFQTPYQLFFSRLKRKRPEEDYNPVHSKRYPSLEPSQQKTSLEIQRYDP